MEFADRYGPWAVIAGASEGTGREIARQVAASGVACILIARREAPLTELADVIRAESKVECVTASVDLAGPDGPEQVISAVAGREVGLFVANAGADPNGAHFLDRDVSTWLDLVQRNVTTTMRLSHHFGTLMKKRRRGGMLLVNSGACYGGGSFLAVYSASKAFELCFGESLWAELRPYDVDVLNLVLGMTDTPAFRALLDEKGLPLPTDWASPQEVAEIGLARLPFGPIHNWGQADDEVGYAPASADGRRARILAVDEGSKAVFGTHDDTD